MPKLAGPNRSDCQLIPKVMQVEYRYATENIEDCFVILCGGLYIKMAALRTLGVLLDSSGRSGALMLPMFCALGKLTRSQSEASISCYRKTSALFSQKADEGQDLEDWCAERVQASPQLHFWWIILHLELTVLIYIRLVREGNFLPYIDALSRIVPWFVALGHNNYARWIPVHLRDMVTLANKHASVYKQFLS